MEAKGLTMPEQPFANAPIAVTPNGSRWLWSWAFAIPQKAKQPEAAGDLPNGRLRKTTSSSLPKMQAGPQFRRAPVGRPMTTLITRNRPLCGGHIKS
jgi:hypothetical protein